MSEEIKVVKNPVTSLVPLEKLLTHYFRYAPSWKKPSYYDAPADKELLRKCMISSKNATVATLYGGLCDAYLVCEYTAVVPIMFRVMHWAVPSFGSFGAFILANAVAVKANGGKDTPGCHFFGGLAFATVWAQFLKRPRLIWFFGAPLGLLMFAFKKSLVDPGLVQNFSVKREAPNYYGADYPPEIAQIDWTLRRWNPEKYTRDI